MAIDRLMEMLGRRPQAGAGRGRVNPPVVEEDPAARRKRLAMESAEKDAASRKAGAAYDRAMPNPEYKKGDCVKKYAKGGVTRADGCATKGKTRGTMR